MIILIGILVVFQGFVKPKLVRTKVNDKISILRPDNWLPMEGMDFIQRTNYEESEDVADLKRFYFMSASTGTFKVSDNIQPVPMPRNLEPWTRDQKIAVAAIIASMILGVLGLL